MLLIPHIPYRYCMVTPIDELVVFCPTCGHSESVHAYPDQLCLFSDCVCSGSGAPRSVVSELRGSDDASAQAANDNVRIWDTGVRRLHTDAL